MNLNGPMRLMQKAWAVLSLSLLLSSPYTNIKHQEVQFWNPLRYLSRCLFQNAFSSQWSKASLSLKIENIYMLIMLIEITEQNFEAALDHVISGMFTSNLGT